MSTGEAIVARYWCVVCRQPILPDEGDPHTDDATGEDCHAECCATCNQSADDLIYSNGPEPYRYAGDASEMKRDTP